ncbi:MAG: hypothetical protein ABR905_12385 [Terracidiphilus sp.]
MTRHSHCGALVFAVALTLCATGCQAPLAKHSVALSAALAPVVDQSAAAYRDALALHQRRLDYEAVVAYENKDASYNPRNAPELLSQKDIESRLAVLAALQMYSKSLVEITKGTDSPELDAASKSVGSNLTSLGNHLAPSIENVLGITAAAGVTTETTVTTTSGSTSTTASSTSSTPAPLLSTEAKNGISAGVNALGQLLVNRIIEKELPGKIVEMDPHVQALSKALSDDDQTLDDLEEHDYNRILNLEKQFILADEEPGKNVNPEQHRAEIMRLPEIAQQQREAKEKLVALREAINKLALTHHALAAEAQHNTPESLKDKLSELADAGSSLGKFYSSLPAK